MASVPRFVSVGALLSALALACAEENPARIDPDQWALDPIQVGSGLVLSARLIPDTSDARAWLVQLLASDTAGVADTIVYGACSFAAALYTEPNLSRPVWDNAPRPGTACILIAYLLPVPSLGTTGATVTSIPPAVPLPAGRYYAGLAFRTAERLWVLSADTVRLPSRSP
jgi:hypothetical protein